MKGQSFIPSSFLPPKSGWWATSPSTPNGRSKWPTPFKNSWRRQISAYNVSTLRASEKVQLWRIGSRTRAFQRAIDEVRTLRLSLQRVAQKANFSFFWIKVNFNWMKSATKFLREKTSSGKIRAITLIPLSNGYIDVGRNTNPSTSNVASKWHTPLT